MMNQAPLYNSRIIKTYIDFLQLKYPDADIHAILSAAGMAQHEVEDAAHWFNQIQVDRFHAETVKATGNLNIARKAGQHILSTQDFGPVKQLALGLFNLESVFLLMNKLYPLVTRGALVSAKKLGPCKTEIIATPAPGVDEKSYQCDNRIGSFEALAALFTDKFADVEHPECYHQGSPHCRYIITWENPPSHNWRKFCRILTWSGIAMILPISFFLPHPLGAWSLTGWFFVALLLAYKAERTARSELAQSLKMHGENARQQLDESNIRYNNALLVQEIGLATSSIFDIDALMYRMAWLMRKRMNYDRGLIMLASPDQTRLIYSAGYGYTPEQKQKLQQISFNILKSDSKGLFTRTYQDQRPILSDNVPKMAKAFSAKSRQLVEELEVQSMICVPIVYKKTSLGILAVDNVESKNPFTESDLNLLKGIASQMAVCIINAQSYQKLHASERRYRQSLESIEEGYFEVDRTGKFTFVNNAMCRITGYSRRELLSLNNRAYADSDTAKKMYKIFNQVYLTGNPVKMATFEVKGKNAQPISVELSASLIRQENGKPTGFRGVIRDVTNRLADEKDRENLENQLRQAQKMEAIGTLAGGIAHDFNNVLSAIMGYTELTLLDLQHDTVNQDRLNEIHKASLRAKDMVKQILAFSRQNEQERLPIEVVPIVKEAVKMLRATLPSTIDIHQDIDPQAGVVHADATQIHQVLMNLCTNAWHAMSDTGGILAVHLNRVEESDLNFDETPDIAPGKYIKLSVRDSGHGIDSDLLERIFEPYFTTKNKDLGTGMGLAVVHGIVKGHGGAISVQSLKGQGSVFNVYLPRVEKQIRPSLAPKEHLPTGHEHILFVDDEKAITDIGKQMLEKLGYTVTTSTSSIEALQLFQSQPNQFDMVITDMTMPKMTGDQFAQKLLEIRSDIPVVICTGYSDRISGAKAQALGLRELVMKPLSMQDLARKVRHVLN